MIIVIPCQRAKGLSDMVESSSNGTTFQQRMRITISDILINQSCHKTAWQKDTSTFGFPIC